MYSSGIGISFGEDQEPLVHLMCKSSSLHKTEERLHLSDNLNLHIAAEFKKVQSSADA